jgi:hypothetical protein
MSGDRSSERPQPNRLHDEAIPNASPFAPDDGPTAEDEASDGELEFGPNWVLVEELLAHVEGLSIDRCVRIEASWATTDPDALDRAHAAVEAALADDEASREQVKRAQARILEWVTKVATPADKSGWVGSAVPARRDAAPAIADAVAALALADLLEPDDADTLYRPWASVVGRPKLPHYEDDATI